MDVDPLFLAYCVDIHSCCPKALYLCASYERRDISKEMNEDEYLEQYTEGLLDQLTQLAVEAGYFEGPLLETTDLDELWPLLIQPYFKDAAPDMNTYPLSALGWMSFIGMAAAALWDEDWEQHGAQPETFYLRIRARLDWDTLDEEILSQYFDIEANSKEGQGYSSFIRRAAELCYTSLVHEDAEPQSVRAFQLLMRSLFALYKIGVALGLGERGYYLEAIEQ